MCVCVFVCVCLYRVFVDDPLVLPRLNEGFRILVFFVGGRTRAFRDLRFEQRLPLARSSTTYLAIDSFVANLLALDSFILSKFYRSERDC